jgi:hypothetical protein
LGLLAHEFTHAARNRQARFVPSTVRSFSESPSSDEENIARGVEVQARDQASSQLEAGSVGADDGADDGIAESIAQPRDWRGLPAPWEAMPALGNAGDTAQTISIDASVTSFAPSYGPGYSPSFAPSTSAPVQAAERGRDLEPVAAVSMAQPSGATEPNLDALANQIYTILKRRLQSETRRGF